MDDFDLELDKAKDDPANPRTGHDDEAEETRLGESIRKRQDYHVLVRVLPTLAGFFMIVDGHRRCRAARRVGLKQLKALLVDRGLTADEIRQIQLRTDVHKKSFSYFERAMAILEVEDSNASLNGKDLATLIDMEPSLVWKYCQARKLSPQSLEAFKTGKIGLKDVVELAKLGHDEQPVLLNLRLGGASTEEVRKEAKKRRDGPAPEEPKETEQAESIKFALNDVVQITVKAKLEDGRGVLTLADVAAHLLAAHKEAAKGKEQGLNVRTFSRVMADRAKKPKAVKA